MNFDLSPPPHCNFDVDRRLLPFDDVSGGLAVVDLGMTSYTYTGRLLFSDQLQDRCLIYITTDYIFKSAWSN